MDEKLGGLGHILTTVFLSSFAGFLVRPVMTDVTVAAVCSGLNDSCSLAVYLTGVQQVVITSTYIYVHIGRSLSLFPIFNLQSLPFSVGLGTMVMMPVIGNLADRYGIKALLTLPMCLSIIPPAILGYRRDTLFFYTYYVIKIIFDMVCQGTVDCLAQAYVAKNIHGTQRISMFGVLAGVRSISAVCATFAARFLPTASTFQVTALSLFVGLVYMRIFLKERLHDDDEDDYDGGGDERMLTEPILENAPTRTHVFYNKYSSLKDMVALMKNSTILVQALAVTFFVTFSQSGMESAFLGKVQGCIYGVKSFAEVVAPFVYSPLTALFLSDNAPFYFPGFSLLCIALSLMIGFLLSLLIKDVPSSLMKKTISSASNEEA
uniref:Major facilitator superfamily (MFS) profile domain-containing protein n=1 Tax=Brassica campestris TaxID=3711 RepID=M4F874_BRACM